MSGSTCIFYYRGGNLKPGGVEVMILRQAQWIQKNSLFVPIILIDESNEFLYEFYSSNGLKVEVVLNKSRPGIFNTSQKIHQVIKKFQGKHFLQSHLFRESIICRLVRFSNVNLKHYFRAETYIDCSEISGFKIFFYHCLDYLTKAWVDLYIANGNLVYKEIKEKSWISSKKIIAVYNGCEQFGSIDRNPIVTPLSIAMVANLLPVKDHPTLFRALYGLKQEGIIINVDLYGDEIDPRSYNNFLSYKAYLEHLVEKWQLQSQVKFRGFCSQLKTELELFQIVVLTSISEGTANAIQEALSVGKLVICSDVYELGFILNQGSSGLLFPSGNDLRLAELLKAIASQPDAKEWKSIREQALIRWEENFSVKIMMDQMHSLYIC